MIIALESWTTEKFHLDEKKKAQGESLKKLIYCLLSLHQKRIWCPVSGNN